jgi:phosphopantothenoylcysteine decarboxylase/phosphopantothenate--cysteine ligase
MAHVLLTAGPTRAYLDDVRYLTNASSGRMAAALAAALVAAGHRVTVVSGPVRIAYSRAVEVVPVTTTEEMLEACLARLSAVDGVIAAAAPCDFQPVTRATGKIPRAPGLQLALAPSVDVVATLAARARPGQWLVAFSLEPDGDAERALAKLEAKACDLVVVNDLAALEATATSVAVFDRRGACLGRRSGSKRSVAGWLVRLLSDRLAPRGPESV